MAEVAKAYIQLVPSAQGIKGSITTLMGGEAESAGKSAGASFSSAFGGALKGLGAATATAFTAASTAAIAAAKSVMDTAQIGDNIDKMSQKMGLSAQAYQEWDAIMQHSGTTIDAMQTGMKTLANAVEKGNNAFQRIGLTQEQIAGMSNEDLFAATIAGLQNVENETERTYLAGQLLGRGATELGALLNTSAEDTDAMRQRVHELGGVMSDEAVKAAAGFQDSMQDMQTALAGIGRTLASDMLPGVKSVVDGLTEVFAGDSNKGIGMIEEGINDLLTNLTERLPEFLEIGGGIIKGIASAIIDSLPELIRIGADILVSLVDGIAENFEDLADAAIMIVLTLVDALTENIDKVIAAIVKIVTAIITKLTEQETLEALIGAALKLMAALVIGIGKAIPEIGKAIWNVGSNIFEALKNWRDSLIEAGKNLIKNIGIGIAEMAKAAFQWGKDLIDNFIQGIKDKFGDLKETIKQLAQTVKDYLGFSEPDLGPLADFHTFAPDMMELFAQGIQQNAKLVTDAVSGAFDVGPQIVDYGFSGAAAPGFAQETTGAGLDTGAAERPINLYATVQLDGRELWAGLLPYKRADESLTGVGFAWS